MLDDKAKSRLIKNIVAALRANDNKILTLASIRWLMDNYALKPNYDLPLRFHFKESRIHKSEFDLFFKQFDLFSFIESDTDLNYRLGLVISYYKKFKFGDSVEWFHCFRQSCEVINEVRRQIQLKNYRVKIRRGWICWRHNGSGGYRGWKYKGQTWTLRGRSMAEAVSRFGLVRRNCRPNEEIYKIKSVKEQGLALYMLWSDKMPELLFRFLTGKTDLL